MNGRVRRAGGVRPALGCPAVAVAGARTAPVRSPGFVLRARTAPVRSPGFVLRSLVLLLPGLLLARPAPVFAAPDFTASEIRISPEAPLERDLVTFTIVLRNGGDEAGRPYFSVEWPLMGFLVDTTGFEGAEIDHDARSLSLMLPLAAGAERRFALRVLAPRDSGGDSLSVAMRASDFASGVEHWDGRNVTIDTRPSAGGVTLGGIRITPAGLATLAVLVVGGLLWLVLRALAGGSSRTRRGGETSGGFLASLVGPGPAAAAITISVGFWILFGAMAWRDWASITIWPETTCTILGGRLSAQSTTSTPGSRGRDVRRDDTNYVPVLGLRYEVGGQTMYSSGYDTGSRLGFGGRSGRAEELGEWTVGATTPCWYDPADPSDVVVLKGFGGAYLFALLPLPVFLAGVMGIRSMLRRR